MLHKIENEKDLRKSGRERGCGKLIDLEICLTKECQSISASLRMDDGANE